MEFVYESPVGLMKIHVDPAKKRYAISVDGKIYSHHPTVSAAANAVYMHETGCREWDNLDGQVEGPEHLGHWRRLK